MTHMPTMPESLKILGICPICKQEVACSVEEFQGIYYLVEPHFNPLTREECESYYATPEKVLTPLTEEQITEHYRILAEQEKAREEQERAYEIAWEQANQKWNSQDYMRSMETADRLISKEF